MTDLMTNLLALIGAIWMIVRVIKLRAIAALPFSKTTVKYVDAVVPGPIADLVEQANIELDELGFEPARWVHVRKPDSGELLQVRVHRQCHAALWFASPTPQAPNRLNAFLVTRLATGEALITQAFDPYLKLLAVDNATVLVSTELSLAGQWNAHCALVASHGSTEPDAISDDGLLAFHAQWMEQQRQALIRAGSLKPINDDTALPSLAFAWTALRTFLRAAKPPPNTQPVPPARAALLATLAERARTRSPSRSVEWTLFVISVALFMGLGALLWDPLTAWMILVVVVIHELGHFLAMRAFGYQNVHMMALPLVGGVAIGQDANPSAHRSAWMSLMGPLPGIVIGWAIIAAVIVGVWPESLGSGWQWATIFLLLNYLNVIPVPPLDGAHVVKALLPPRQAWIEIGFVGIACVLGAIAAFMFDFVILALLALLQLFTLRPSWQAHRALAHLAHQPPAAGQPRPVRLRAVADSLQASLGPTPHGELRINQVIEVLRRLDQKPMRAWQTLLVSTTMALLLAVPIAWALFAYGMAGSADESIAASEALTQATAPQIEALRARAEQKSDAELLSAVAQQRVWAKASGLPASAADIATAQQRLGSMPGELRSLYQHHDGVEALSLLPVQKLTLAGNAIDRWFEYVEGDGYSADLYSADPNANHRSREFKKAELRSWILLADPDDESLLLLNPADGDVRVLELLYESSTAYQSVRDWLMAHYLGDASGRIYAAHRNEQARALFEQSVSADWDEVLSALEIEVPFPLNLLTGEAPELPGPASRADIAAAEIRLGRSLPSDYLELLSRHDGHRMLGVGPIAAVHVVGAQHLSSYQPPDSRVMADMADAYPGAFPVSVDDKNALVGCLNLSDSKRGAIEVLLCPSGHPHQGAVDLRRLLRYPDLLTMARSHAAMMAAAP